jgi:hypothetical protein
MELVKIPRRGMVVSLMRGVVMAEKAPPMMTPTAMPITFP